MYKISNKQVFITMLRTLLFLELPKILFSSLLMLLFTLTKMYTW